MIGPPSIPTLWEYLVGFRRSVRRGSQRSRPRPARCSSGRPGGPLPGVRRPFGPAAARVDRGTSSSGIACGRLPDVAVALGVGSAAAASRQAAAAARCPGLRSTGHHPATAIGAAGQPDTGRQHPIRHDTSGRLWRPRDSCPADNGPLGNHSRGTNSWSNGSRGTGSYDERPGRTATSATRPSATGSSAIGHCACAPLAASSSDYTPAAATFDDIPRRAGRPNR